jgi:hypothetical protein
MEKAAAFGMTYGTSWGGKKRDKCLQVTKLLDHSKPSLSSFYCYPVPLITNFV